MHKQHRALRSSRARFVVGILVLFFATLPTHVHATSIIEDTVYGLVKGSAILTMTAEELLKDAARSFHTTARNAGAALIENTTSLAATTAEVQTVAERLYCSFGTFFKLSCDKETETPLIIATPDDTPITPSLPTTTPIQIHTQSVSSDTGKTYVTNTYPTYYTYPTTYVYETAAPISGDYVSYSSFEKQIDAIFNSMEDGDSSSSFDITAASIESLQDVADMAETAGDLLSWNGASWTNIATSTLGISSFGATDIDTSAELLAILTDETGTGSLVFSAGPTFTGNTTLANASTTNLTVSGSSYLGTVTSGTWNGSAITVPYGGTGATSLTGLLLGNGTSAFTATTTLSASYIEDVYLRNTGDIATGDYTFDTDTLFIDASNNRVGIGTTSPASSLHIDTANTSLPSTITLTRGGADAAVIGVSAGTHNFFTNAGAGSLNLRSGIGDSINLGSLSVATPSVTINSSGNVGIGTTTPGAKLHVYGGLSGSSMPNGASMIIESDTGNYLSLLSPATSTAGIWFGDSGDSAIGRIEYSHSNDSMAFRINGSDRMTINSSGSVIIGTESSSTGTPKTRIGVGHLGLSGSAAQVVEALHLDGYTQDYDKGIALSFGRNDNTNGAYTSRIVHYGDIASTRASKLQIQTHSATQGVWNTGLFMDDTGDVGIAMTNPSVALDVTGSIEYTGTIADVSDRRLKRDIHQLSGNLAKILTLEPVSFTMKNDASSTPQLGFIAQNVLEAYTEPIVYIDPEHSDYLGLDYTQLVAPTVGALIELHTELSDLFMYGTTTASSTFSSLFDDHTDTVWQRLVTLAQHFVDGVLTIAGIETERVKTDAVETELLCVGEICVTEEEFRNVFSGSNQNASVSEHEEPEGEEDPEAVDNTSEIGSEEDGEKESTDETPPLVEGEAEVSEENTEASGGEAAAEGGVTDDTASDAEETDNATASEETAPEAGNVSQGGGADTPL